MGHNNNTLKNNKPEKSEKSFFSVIVPTYNRAKYVVRTIESILAQTEEKPEIIVIDDGSTDNTAEALKLYQTKIKYYYTENKGVSAARNLGIKNASADWIAFLDSDDEWLPNYLATQKQNIENHPECCMHMMNSWQINFQNKKINTFEDNPCSIPAKHALYKPNDPFWFVLKNHLYYLQPTVIRKSTLFATAMFNEKINIAEDLDLIARVAIQGPMAIYNTPLVSIYRREENNINLTKQIFTNGIHSQNVLGEIYNSLLTIPELKHIQKKLLRTLYAANRRAVGNLYLRKGSRRQTINSYWKAMQIDHSWRSATRLILALLPRNIALKTIGKEWNVTP
ncbi:MAG: glycosyltransferase [Desulfobulbaceae bacterium]|nr:glycosyltransferase [Desulfobulbaceae bacterium]